MKRFRLDADVVSKFDDLRDAGDAAAVIGATEHVHRLRLGL